MYLAEAPKLVADLRSAAAAGDAELLRRTAHTLKTACTYFDGKGVAEAAYRVESGVRDGQLEAAVCEIEPLSAAVDRLLATLRPLAMPESPAAGDAGN